ncbi:MAG: pyridoxamine 5'-phosphate oxidase family protein [Bacteroidales bacterium]|jgi:uncharacterized pyridoxamine 5'-phosphate oxidase family protein|nr:pyridoxamine 5'-phosphate oxidase family protein [Bacteroidales bacterium]
MKKIMLLIAACLLSSGISAQQNEEKNQEQTKNEAMLQVYDFLKQAKTYYLATVDENKPRVRPFGTINLFEEKLYIQTGRSKKVAEQMRLNPQIEICAMWENKWIRIEATVVPDDRREAKESMLMAYPELQSKYSADDFETLVLFLQNVKATFYSFNDKPYEVTF